MIPGTEFADDNIHPNARENELVAGLIAHFLDTVAEQEEDAEESILQKPFYGVSYKDVKMLDSENFTLLSMAGLKKHIL